MMLVPRRNFDLFDDFFDDPFFKGELRPSAHEMPMMKTDIRENEHSYTLDIDLPGFDKNNIKIDVQNGYLNVNAKVDSSNKEEEKGKFIKRERYMGECSRSFYIGDEVKEDEIKAAFDNGILTLEIPKKTEDEKATEKKYIDIQ